MHFAVDFKPEPKEKDKLSHSSVLCVRTMSEIIEQGKSTGLEVILIIFIKNYSAQTLKANKE